jgi:hypothetical protein
MYELIMRSRYSRQLIRVFQFVPETKRCVSLYVLVINYAYTFGYYNKEHKIAGSFTNVKSPLCGNSCFLCTVCLFVPPQIILELICHDSWSSVGRSWRKIIALSSAIPRRQTSYIVAFWIVRVNSIKPRYFMLDIILWSAPKKIHQDPRVYVSCDVHNVAVEWNVVAAAWQVKAELMWKVNSTSRKGALISREVCLDSWA